MCFLFSQQPCETVFFHHLKEDPYMDSEADDRRLVQPPDDHDTSSDSDVSMKSDNSHGHIVDFSVKPEDPYMDSESDDGGSVQPPDDLPEDPDMDPEADDGVDPVPVKHPLTPVCPSRVIIQKVASLISLSTKPCTTR